MTDLNLAPIAHQRLMKDYHRENPEPSLFGELIPEVVDIKTAIVREITPHTAASIILKYEWLKSMPAVVLKCYGIYFDGVLGGAVVYSPEYAENLGVWNRYGFTGRIILLARGATTHWAHKHTASKLIRASMKLLPKPYEVVTCTVDAAAGEIGTIYQACGFHYVGTMRAENPLSRTSTVARYVGRNKKGELVSGRSYRRHARVLEKELSVSKARYFAFIGDKKTKERDLDAIAPLLKPYPKRPSLEQTG